MPKLLKLKLDSLVQSAPYAPPVPEDADLAALQQFVRLCPLHMQCEDRLVYPAAQAVLTPKALQGMGLDMMRRGGIGM